MGIDAPHFKRCEKGIGPPAPGPPESGRALARVRYTAPPTQDTPASRRPHVAEPKPTISFEEFVKVDLRVARVVKAEEHPNADRLLRLQLDDGSGEPRQICAGVRGHYQPADLEGRLIIIVANLAPRTIRGEESRGMLLAASDAPKDGAGEERNVILLTPMSDIAPGSAVS
ncbi:MAG: methionine--tRNA ligase subunit beta [Phycisphaeraceae bacterium]|nr:MAG: methionine--tRNA ligase subunit beta [Phycisphaeraceae bacterium]